MALPTAPQPQHYVFKQGGSIEQWLAYLPPDPSAPVLIHSVPNLSNIVKIVDVAEVNHQGCLVESLSNHLVLARSKLVLQKDFKHWRTHSRRPFKKFFFCQNVTEFFWMKRSFHFFIHLSTNFKKLSCFNVATGLLISSLVGGNSKWSNNSTHFCHSEKATIHFDTIISSQLRAVVVSTVVSSQLPHD